MQQLTIEQCRSLIDGGAKHLSDAEIEQLRVELYTMAATIVDLYDGLGTLDQSLLSPRGDIWDQLTHYHSEVIH